MYIEEAVDKDENHGREVVFLMMLCPTKQLKLA
jgi:hypothetical protein